MTQTDEFHFNGEKKKKHILSSLVSNKDLLTFRYSNMSCGYLKEFALPSKCANFFLSEMFYNIFPKLAGSYLR